MASQAKQSDFAPEPGAIGGITRELQIVVVDPEPWGKASINRLLQSTDSFSIIDVAQVQAAENLLKDTRPDVVCLDLSASSSMGLSGLRRLRAVASSTVAFIVFTSVEESYIGMDAINAYAQDCIFREGISRPALVRRIRQAVERHRLECGMRQLIETNPDGIIVLDPDNEVLFSNPAASVFLETRPGTLIGSKVAWTLKDAGNNQVHLEDGRLTDMRVAEIQWQGHLARMVTVRDVTKSQNDDMEVHRRANYDAITGLPNRTLFMDRLEQAIANLQRTEHSLSVMFLDLDRFKWVNDSLGHAAGDELLLQVGQRLSTCVRNSDTVARLSGDEFVILLQQVNGVEGTRRVAGKILKDLSRPFQLSRHKEISITASIGISLCPENGRDVYSMLNTADTAMYQAKASGRNTFAFYSHELQQQVMFQLELAEDLEVALAENELALFYQPVIDLKTGVAGDVEALLRWEHKQHGTLDTRIVLDIATQAGLMSELDDWVLRTAVDQAVKWRKEIEQPPRIWVNISGTRRDEPYVTHLVEILEAVDDDVLIGLEITDPGMFDHIEDRQQCLDDLRATGVSVALDDFFASFSSLNDLRDLPLDVVKIDCDITRSMAEKPEDFALVKSVIELAHRLGMRTVCEGVETQKQFDTMKETGCDAVQGFLFKEALPADQLPPLLHSQSWSV